MAKFRRQHAKGSSNRLTGYYFRFGIFFALIMGVLLVYRVYNKTPVAEHKNQKFYELKGGAHSDDFISPGGSYLPYATYGEVIVDPHFSMAYSEQHEQALWVAHDLKRDNLKTRKAERSDWYEEDHRVTTGSARHADYSRSGYTRGHLAPAADFVHDQAAMDKTFLMSNISPQLANFNGGIWRELEEQIRDWVRLKEHLYIVTGPVFYEHDTVQIGKNGVTVPSAFYKVILDPVPPELKGIAFLIPHKVTDEPLAKYALTIRELENITGIDFFPDLLERELQDSIEQNYDIGQWPFDEARYQRRISIWNKRSEYE